MPSAIPGSVLFKCKDADDDDCEFAILIYYDKQTGNEFIVVHALERINEMEKIKIKNYIHTDLLGTVTSDVEVYVDSNIDTATFNQKSTDFGLDDDEINRFDRFDSL